MEDVIDRAFDTVGRAIENRFHILMSLEPALSAQSIKEHAKEVEDEVQILS